MSNFSELSNLLREPEGLRYNGVAVIYAAVGYAAGLAGLFAGHWLLNLGAVLVLAHAMTISAYMIHECGHNLVFKSIRNNAVLGRVLSWLCGAAYGTYEDIRYKHFRHHVDNDDIMWFDYEKFFMDHPLILKITRVLEWFYIPAHDLIMHFIMVFTSFIIPQRRNQRARNVAVIVVRGGLFLALLIWFPKVALLYAVAYMLMMTILRFMDSLQHDYPYTLTLFEFEKPERKGDFEWEQEHTFSNPLSLKYEMVNWITLNFGFHNAHHDDMTIPWYRLRAKHREMFADDPASVIPLSAQLKIFHKQRVRRIVGNHDGAEPSGREFLLAAQRAEVYGGNAASFLTSF
ncbi:MAG: omega-6 fatty acid desaturase (delta-12 desaturase) [Woeseiaceae bacterium]|jgi:omega-6 fatty acid desaturase (delta-12 desaturase)